MPQTLVQQQKLSQEQIQLQSAMQVLAAKLTELPIEGLRERIQNELDENPYLEANSMESAEETYISPTGNEDGGETVYDPQKDYASIEDIPDYLLNQTYGHEHEAEGSNIDSGDSQSFYDQLMEQAGGFDLSAHDRHILEYIIGNLDDDGLLTKPLYQLADELQIYHYCDTTPEEVERVLHILWLFEPAGVGARSLQECLIIQCRRKGVQNSNWHHTLLLKILEQNWTDISHNRWDLIAQKHNLTETQVHALRQDMKRLNPRPGSAMGEKSTSAEMHITPDVVVEVDLDGRIELTLNDADMPSLSISEDANEMLTESFVREYVNRGQLFIAAITQRRNTIMRTMQAIIRLQRQYFLSGDENLLRPMKLEDVANITHQDLSTISRVCNSKYVETPYGTYSLKWFFSNSTRVGEADASVRRLRQAMKTLIEEEDKSHPLTDDAIVQLLTRQGYNVARRTVAKYREEMNIPTSRMRRGR